MSGTRGPRHPLPIEEEEGAGNTRGTQGGCHVFHRTHISPRFFPLPPPPPGGNPDLRSTVPSSPSGDSQMRASGVGPPLRSPTPRH